jgi:raffinose/stachyose/melibiose transport system substrate-binding protein
MNSQNEDRKNQRRNRLRNGLALFILAGAFIASAIQVGLRHFTHTAEVREGKRIIRIAHSIADRKVQKAFASVVDEYESLNPNVRVIVQAIPQRAYVQWLTTQCLGGTAPDLVQAENRYNLWATLAARYMTPVSPYLNSPNPYNKGTVLEGIPWRETYLDGMNGGYWPHLTEYYSIPVTIETARIFYNRDIFTAANGSPQPPENIQDWFSICENIQRHAAEKNLTLYPIAGTREHMPFILQRYYDSFGNGIGDHYDTVYWQGRGPECTLFGLYTGTFSFNLPPIRDAFSLVRHLADYCQPGFVSSDISQARFLFLQEKCAMIFGGARDAAIYLNAAEFDLGVFNIPMPHAADPKYGEYHNARRPTEASTSNIHFCLSQQSMYPESALDFMKFMTSRKGNEEFNQKVGWYPAIRHAKPLEVLKAFKPVVEGSGGRVPAFLIPPSVSLWFSQQFPRYLDDQITFEEFIDGLENIWLTKGAEDFVRRDQLFSRVLIQGERNIAGAKARMLFEEAGDLRAGELVGQRTSYQLALEVVALLEFGISARTYTWHHLQQGNYEYP